LKSGRRFGLSLVLVLYLIMEAWAAPERSPDILSVRKTGAISACVKAMGLDLLMEKDGRIFIVAGPHDAARLSALDIPFTIETPRFAPAAAGDVRIAGGTNGAFHTYAELEADLKALESAHPGIVKVYSIGTSLENRTIYAVKISDNVAADEDEAEVLFLGCHHAREWISVEVPFQLARYLAGNYDRDAGIRDLVDRSEIWIVPLVNPDGLEYSINVYRYWRKNRRANADGSFGVDVNRNYGFMWGYDNEGSSPEPSSEIYRGTAPFSEPESRAVRDLFLSRPFRALVSYHSYAQSILYPWSFIDAPTDRDALLGGLGLDMADLIEAVNGRAYTVGRGAAALYTTNGDTTDWAFGIAGIPAYTIELPPMNAYLGGFVNAENDIDGVFRENLPAMLRVLGYAVAVPATTQASGANRARDREKSRVMDKNARPVK
jgi:carboxypeptidase T